MCSRLGKFVENVTMLMLVINASVVDLEYFYAKPVLHQFTTRFVCSALLNNGKVRTQA